MEKPEKKPEKKKRRKKIEATGCSNSCPEHKKTFQNHRIAIITQYNYFQFNIH